MELGQKSMVFLMCPIGVLLAVVFNFQQKSLIKSFWEKTDIFEGYPKFGGSK